MLSGRISSKKLDKSYIWNDDETHFISNVDSEKALGFPGLEWAKYAHVVRGGERYIGFIRLNCRRDAKIEPLSLVVREYGQKLHANGTQIMLMTLHMAQTLAQVWADYRVFLNGPMFYRTSKCTIFDQHWNKILFSNLHQRCPNLWQFHHSKDKKSMAYQVGDLKHG